MKKPLIRLKNKHRCPLLTRNSTVIPGYIFQILKEIQKNTPVGKTKCKI